MIMQKNLRNEMQIPNKMKVYFLLILIFTLTSGCGSELETSAIPISVQEVTELIKSGTAPVILDVRSEEEFAKGHIPGAINISHTEVGARMSEISLSKSDQVIVHCQSGGRARLAQAVLDKNGFTNLRDLDGHWQVWSASGLPVEL
jgi:phage shock protein E